MAKRRIVNTRFWSDSYISDLDPSEKLMFLYLITNPYTNVCGAYEIPLKQVAVDTGFDRVVVQKILDRFIRDGKVHYVGQYVVITNFIKHQELNPSVRKGIERDLSDLPEEVRKVVYDSLPTDWIQLGTPNLTKPNLTKPNLAGGEHSLAPEVFSLEEEITKLEDSPERHLNIIALYLEHRKPNIISREQYRTTLSRHVRPAKALVPFTNTQLLKALDHAKREYKDIYTLETLAKLLTK